MGAVSRERSMWLAGRLRCEIFVAPSIWHRIDVVEEHIVRVRRRRRWLRSMGPRGRNGERLIGGSWRPLWTGSRRGME